MFEEMRFDGSPMTRGYAEARAKWEPLFETIQIKGQSEAHPELSPTDEFAGMISGIDANLNGVPKKPGMRRTEYWREALKSGLRLEATLGANPFKYGANGATDTHTGLPTSDEDNFWGKFKSLEPSAERWKRPVTRRQGRVAAGGRRQDGRLGNGQYARGALGRHEAARDLLDERAAHDRALLRWLRLRGRRCQGRYRGGGLREGRADGRRPRVRARGQGADLPVRRDEGSGRGPISIGSRS